MDKFLYYKKWTLAYLYSELDEITQCKELRKSTVEFTVCSGEKCNFLQRIKRIAGKLVRHISGRIETRKRKIKRAIDEISENKNFDELDSALDKYRELFRKKDGSFPKEYEEIQLASGKKMMELIDKYKKEYLYGGFDMKDTEFEALKAKVLTHLEELEKQENSEKKEVKKSLLEAESMEKGGKGLPVGTVREWKGKKYVKISQGKWKAKYDNEGRGAKMAISALKKKADACTDAKELLQLMLENRDRFSDSNGRPLPIVKELSDYVSKRNDELESKANAAEQKKEDSTTQAWEKIPGLNGKPMFANKPSLAELKEQLYFAEKANKKGVISGNEEFVKKQIKYLRQAIKESGEIDESAAKKKKEKEEKINSLATNFANQLELASKQGRKQALEDVIKRKGEKSAAGIAAKRLLNSDFVIEQKKETEENPEDKKLSNGKTVNEMREKYGIKVDDDNPKETIESLTKLYSSTNDPDEREKILNKIMELEKKEDEKPVSGGKNKFQIAADKEDESFYVAEKDAQEKYGNKTIDELQKLMDTKYKDVKRGTPEYMEAMKIGDMIQQKKLQAKKAEKKSKIVVRKSVYEDCVKRLRGE